MRRALTLACHHVRNRRAFGQRIADLPQMRNALADLALEWEAALLLGMRMAAALDNEDQSPHDRHLLRVAVPIAKYWNCRRTNHFVLEALECHGGMGYVEEQPIARLMREAPINSIWEGTAPMMGLDFVRPSSAIPKPGRLCWRKSAPERAATVASRALPPSWRMTSTAPTTISSRMRAG